MELITINSFQCTNCGASISVDKIKRKALCEYCNTEFSLHLCEQAETEFYILRGNATLRLKNYCEARSFYEKAIAISPQDWRSWFGIVQCYTKNFTYFEKEHLIPLSEARRLADYETNIKIEKEYENYAKQLELNTKREQNAHIMKQYTNKGFLNATHAKIVNSVIPTCPFCKSVSNWHERRDSTVFFKCPSCLAEIRVRLTFFTNKVKTIDIINIGIINNDFSIGPIDPKLIVPSPLNIR